MLIKLCAYPGQFLTIGKQNLATREPRLRGRSDTLLWQQLFEQQCQICSKTRHWARLPILCR
jgi:hypothetical protein